MTKLFSEGYAVDLIALSLLAIVVKEIHEHTHIKPPTSVHTVELMCQAVAFRLLQEYCTIG